MRNAVILGTGGHARVVISMLLQTGKYEISDILELGELRDNETILGIPINATSEKLSSYQGQSLVDVFLAIGNNDLRREWWNKVKALNFPLPNLVSSSAIVDRFAELGEGNIICAKAFLGPNCKIGYNNLVNTGAMLDHEVKVGNHCHLCPAVTIAGRVKIHDQCFLGAGTVVVDGLTIALNTVVGAGSVLIEDINVPNGTYVGVPAKRLGKSL